MEYDKVTLLQKRWVAGGLFDCRLAAGRLSLPRRGGCFVKLHSEPDTDGVWAMLCGVADQEVRVLFAADVPESLVLASGKSGVEWSLSGPYTKGFGSRRGNTLCVGEGRQSYLLLSALDEGSCDCLMGFCTDDDVTMLHELQERFGELTVLTADGSYGEQGRVVQKLPSILAAGNYETVLCCASLQTIAEIEPVCRQRAITVHAVAAIGCAPARVKEET